MDRTGIIYNFAGSFSNSAFSPCYLHDPKPLCLAHRDFRGPAISNTRCPCRAAVLHGFRGDCCARTSRHGTGVDGGFNAQCGRGILATVVDDWERHQTDGVASHHSGGGGHGNQSSGRYCGLSARAWRGTARHFAPGVAVKITLRGRVGGGACAA